MKSVFAGTSTELFATLGALTSGLVSVTFAALSWGGVAFPLKVLINKNEIESILEIIKISKEKKKYSNNYKKIN